MIEAGRAAVAGPGAARRRLGPGRDRHGRGGGRAAPARRSAPADRRAGGAGGLKLLSLCLPLAASLIAARANGADEMRSCLVVDDSKVIRKVARHILETLNFSVDEAEDGREALTAARRACPTSILLDWNMPVMSGMEFLRALRQTELRSPAQGRLLHHRERRRPYPRRDRRRRRRICDEAVRPRDARKQAADRRRRVSAADRHSRGGGSDRPAEPPIRLMIVDDSQVARAVLSRMVAGHRGFRDRRHRRQRRRGARRAEERQRRHRPARRRDARRERPRGAARDHRGAGRGARVLIVSSMAEDGAEATVRALALGAADTLPKPGTGNFAGRFSEVLADRLRRIGRAERESRRGRARRRRPPIQLRDMPDGAARLPRARRLDRRPACPDRIPARAAGRIGAPILVTQHLPAVFMPFFARQLEARVRPRRPRRRGRASCCVAERDPRRAGRRPSLRRAAAAARCASGSTASARRRAACPRSIRCSPRSPTPMATSGARRDAERHGPRRPRRQPRSWSTRGGAMLAQDRQSAAIWGMPRAVAEAGLASAVLPPAELARRIAARVGGARMEVSDSSQPHPRRPARGAHRPAADDEPPLADRDRA